MRESPFEKAGPKKRRNGHRQVLQVWPEEPGEPMINYARQPEKRTR